MFLARAVRPAELASIRQLGSFANVVGIEVKYFATSIDAARRFAAMADTRFGDGPYTIVTTYIDRVLLLPPGSRVIVDGGIEAIAIPSGLLYSLQPPTVLEGS